MLKRITVLGVIIAILLTQSGCWDRWELEDLAYVVAVGCDSAPDNPNDRIVTLKIIIPAKLAGGSDKSSGGGDGPSFNITVRAPSLTTAIDLAQGAVVRRLSLLQCRAIFIGRECAEKEILSVVGVISRYNELRRDVIMIIVDGKAQEFLKQDIAPLEVNPARYYEKVATVNDFSGFTAQSTLQEVVAGLESSGSNALIALASLKHSSPFTEQTEVKAGEIPREGGKPTEFIGLAAFKGATMVGTLNNQQSKAAHMLRGDLDTADVNLKDPNEPERTVGLRLKQDKKPKIVVDISGDTPTVEVYTKYEAHLLSQTGKTNYTELENLIQLEEAAEVEITAWMQDTITLSQQEFKSDILSIGSHAVTKKFRTWQQWNDYNWAEQFPKAAISAYVEVEIMWFGMQTKPTVEEP